MKKNLKKFIICLFSAFIFNTFSKKKSHHNSSKTIPALSSNKVIFKGQINIDNSNETLGDNQFPLLLAGTMCYNDPHGYYSLTLKKNRVNAFIEKKEYYFILAIDIKPQCESKNNITHFQIENIDKAHIYKITYSKNKWHCDRKNTSEAHEINGSNSVFMMIDPQYVVGIEMQDQPQNTPHMIFLPKVLISANQKEISTASNAAMLASIPHRLTHTQIHHNHQETTNSRGQRISILTTTK